MCRPVWNRLMASGRLSHIAASARAVRQIAGALDEFCLRERLPTDVAWQLRVAVDEIVSNIVTHASAGAPAAIDVDFRREGNAVEIAIADDGPAFDPFGRPDPDVSAPLDAREPGGLGIFLVKSLMDDVRYTRTAKNVVTLYKRLRPVSLPGEHGVS
jgi:serine/threonine-protein kinase RsbW